MPRAIVAVAAVPRASRLTVDALVVAVLLDLDPHAPGARPDRRGRREQPTGGEFLLSLADRVKV